VASQAIVHVLNNVSFFSNIANGSSAFGGALHADCQGLTCSSSDRQLLIQGGALFVNNSAVGAGCGAGAVFSGAQVNALLEDVTFTGNSLAEWTTYGGKGAAFQSTGSGRCGLQPGCSCSHMLRPCTSCSHKQPLQQVRTQA
jgi:hypothetical protein